MSGLSLLLTLCWNAAPGAATGEYDPLRMEAAEARTVDLTVTDAARRRDLPIRVYLPKSAAAPAPVVLFSHGLGGSREGSPFLGKHWAARGYVAVFLQHPGSDDSVWKNKTAGKGLAAMRDAASAKNFLLRAQDVPAVLDQLEKWNDQQGHVLAGRLDMRRIGMSGHSFGAITTQAVSGQDFSLIGPRLTEPRIRAAVIMSPSPPQRGDAKTGFGKVKTPWLLMTGSKDTSFINNQTAESRRLVYPALPAGDKYELVLDKAEHSVFTERALPGDTERRNPNHHRAILAISTAFWDAYLRDDPAAKKWLTGDGPRRLLEPGDIWQQK